MKLPPARRISTAALLLAGVLSVACIPVSAQPQGAPPASAPTPGAARSPACYRLEAQLSAFDRGGGMDAARSDQVRRYEEATAKQQADLDRLTAQARRAGCEGRGFFSLFSGQSPQCSAVNNQIQQARANLDRLLADAQRAQGNNGDRDGQRRAILAALAQNDCGPQYRQFANQGFFEGLFGGNNAIFNPSGPAGETYRTLCVRTCDGYYFPISYATVPSKFADDEKVCQRMCPAAEVMLFSHRNPGEDVSQAVSISGQPYSQLPNAFSYRKHFDASCTCKGIGQTWAEALKQIEDQTVERGDIVVTTEEQARRLSQPQTDAQGKPIRPAPASRPVQQQKGMPAVSPAAATTETAPEEIDPSKRKVRSVGPPFLPVR